MSGVLQHYLVVILTNKYIELFSGTSETYLWKSKGISEEIIKNTAGPNQNFASNLTGSYSLPDATFNGHCLMNSNNSIFKKLINPYISYTCSRDLNTDFT